MQKALIIIPYFGKLPEWFNLFLLSSSKTEIFDFVLLTDDKTLYKYPANFKVIYSSFQEMQDVFKQKLGADTYVGIPYKLCDYRPAYGYVFEELVKEYAFWGYCDIDLIFGDIDAFLNKISFEQYDRVFPLGHLTLYRNTKVVNELFKTKLGNGKLRLFDFDFVRKTTYPCHFDEIGMNYLLEHKNVRYCKDVLCKNVNMNIKNFMVDGGESPHPELIYYKGKNVYVGRLVNGRVEEMEIMYIHIQNRKNLKVKGEIDNDFLIYEEGFRPLEQDKIIEYFEQHGVRYSKEEQDAFLESVTQNARKAQKTKIIRELKTYGVKGLVNIYKRYESTRFINKNRFY